MGKMPTKPPMMSKPAKVAKVMAKTPVNMLAGGPAPGSSTIPGKRGKKAKPSSTPKMATMKMKKPKAGSKLTLFSQDKDMDGQ